MSRLTVGSLEGLSENSNVISVPTGHTLNAVDGLQIGGVALGAATAFTPSWTNFTLGNGTQEWYSTQIGDLVVVTGRVVYGSTSSIAANSFGFAPPVTPAFVVSGNLRLIDVGTASYPGRIYFHTDNTFRFSATYSAGTGYVTLQQIINVTPYTFVAGDWFDASIVYKAAT